MKLHPNEVVLLVDHLERMRAVAVHETETVGNATIGVQNEKLDVRTFRRPNIMHREGVEGSLDAWPSDGWQRSPRPYSDLSDAFVGFVFENE